MDSRIFKNRIQRRLYHACASDCDSESDLEGLSTSSLPLTETCMEYFQDSFPGSEGLGRLDMPMAATVTKRNQVSPCSMVMSMMYAKRLRQRNKQYLQAMSSSDVFFISMMMASKYLYDEGVDEEVYNDEWAASVGHETDDVNQMEMDFLKEMDWHLFAKQDDFDKALTAVERRLALKEGVKRGWFTYTEMAVLLDWDPVCNLWNQVGMDCTKMVSLLSAVYVASLVSMMGSAAVAVQLSGPVASATMAAILSLQASTTSTTSPMPRPLSVDVPCNQSSMDKAVIRVNGVKDDMSLPSELELAGPKENGVEDQNCSLLHSEKVTVGFDGPKEDSLKNDGKGKGSGTVSKPKLKSASSVFSMWLFDSLISQVWSVFGASSASLDGNIQSEGELNNDKSLSSGDVVVGGTFCRRFRRMEQKISKGADDRSAKHSKHMSENCGNERFSCMDKVDDHGVDFASRLGENHFDFNDHYSTPSKGCFCASHECFSHSHHPAVRNSDSCKCSSYCNRLQKGSSEHENPVTTSPSGRVSKPHQEKNHAGKNYVPPFSIMTEVPILDHVGFFTKNSSPASYVLST